MPLEEALLEPTFYPAAYVVRLHRKDSEQSFTHMHKNTLTHSVCVEHGYEEVSVFVSWMA